MSPEIQLLVVFAVFLGLLTIGMSIPFAITVPAVLYLLLQGGIPALNSLGLVSWANLNSFTLTAIPLFILMAEILQGSGLTTASDILYSYLDSNGSPIFVAGHWHPPAETVAILCAALQ